MSKYLLPNCCLPNNFFPKSYLPKNILSFYASLCLSMSLSVSLSLSLSVSLCISLSIYSMYGPRAISYLLLGPWIANSKKQLIRYFTLPVSNVVACLLYTSLFLTTWLIFSNLYCQGAALSSTCQFWVLFWFGCFANISNTV